MTLTNLLQLLVGGMAMGAIYTLTAKGLFITHLTTAPHEFRPGRLPDGGRLPVARGPRRRLALARRGPGVVLVLALMGWGLERFAVRPLDRLGAAAAARMPGS